jgi:DNA damage-binding protein 1
MTLQTNLADLVHTPGDMPFAKYRAFKNQVREADEPFRFVDGELIFGFGRGCAEQGSCGLGR